MRILVVFSILILAGCVFEGPDSTSDPIEDKEVFGIYCANFGNATRDCIELQPDSMYVHYYRFSDHAYVDTASWEYQCYPKPEYLAYLRDFKIRHPRVGRCFYLPPKGEVDTTLVNLPMDMHKSGDHIQIEYCWSRFENYIKADSSTAENVREEMRQLGQSRNLTDTIRK